MQPSNVQVQIDWDRSGFHLDVALNLPSHGTTVLFGPSGCGKTTVLRCMAGLERAPSAHIAVNGQTWQDSQRFVPTWKRPLGMVFQEARLLQHLNVSGNVAFGLPRQQRHRVRQTLEPVIETLGIGHLWERPVQQLSGGEQQRVAIARAWAAQPELLLLDEPLAALDWRRKQDILPWLERLQSNLKIPMVYVTHSIDEALRLADHVVVLEAGQVQAQGSLHEVLARTDTPLAQADEASSLIEARVTSIDADWHLAHAQFDGGELSVRDSGLCAGQTVRLRLLARDVSITTQAAHHTSIQNQLVGVIERMAPANHPAQALVQLRCGSQLILSRVTQKAVHELDLSVGQSVWAQIKTVALAR